jgi:hypothetical protein
MVETSTNICDRLNEELVLGRLEVGGFEGDIDELRLQNISTSTSRCGGQ